MQWIDLIEYIVWAYTMWETDCRSASWGGEVLDVFESRVCVLFRICVFCSEHEYHREPLLRFFVDHFRAASPFSYPSHFS